MQTKICTKCKVEKELSEFNKHKDTKFGVSSICRICAKKYYFQNLDKYKIYHQNGKENRYKTTKIWREKNKEKIAKQRKEYRKKYQQKNKEKIAKQRKEYQELNKEKYNKYQKFHHKKYYSSNINYKISTCLRSRFKRALGRNTKSGSAIKMLACSIEEFKKYFESLFTEGMTWAKVHNGEIHIDHKRPLASFDLSIPEEQAKACHYTNLQPLWAVDNMKKGDKYVPKYKSL